jgi:hypothetical protein
MSLGINFLKKDLNLCIELTAQIEVFCAVWDQFDRLNYYKSGYICEIWAIWK